MKLFAVSRQTTFYVLNAKIVYILSSQLPTLTTPSLQLYEMEVDASNRLEAVLGPTPIGNHIKVGVGCKTACGSNPLHFEPIEIDQKA